MSSNFGFRYFITGMKDDKYGIKDIEDLVTEFYSYDEVMGIAKSVPIKGVDSKGVDTNWFTGFIRKEWHFRKSDLDFIEKTGLCFIEDCGKLVLAHVAGFSEIAFIEFIGTFSACIYDDNAGKAFLSVEKPAIGYKGMMYILKGVGFNFITINRLRNIPVECLTMFDFDKVCTDSDNLCVSVRWTKDRNYILNGEIKSSRNMFIEFSGNGYMQLEKLTSSQGRINLDFYADNIRVADSFLSNLCGSLSITAGRVCVDSTVQLARLVKSGCIINETGTFDLVYSLDGTDKLRHTCKVINSVPRNGVEFGVACDMFVFMRKVKPRLRMTRELYNKFMEETDFSKRHYIDKVTFSSFVEFI